MRSVIPQQLIPQHWIYATMRIENDWGEEGTGFLVGRRVSKNKGRLFLVTNKHVLNDDPALRNEARCVTLHYNLKETNGAIQRADTCWPLGSNGIKFWREHPNPHMDVLAIEVTGFRRKCRPADPTTQIAVEWLTYADFADSAKLKEFEISIGDRIFVIGYPLTLRHHAHNLPLMRQGILATRIGEELEDAPANGQSRTRVVRRFLIDGITIPGSSGSMVVLDPQPLPPPTRTFMSYLAGMQPLLLGIVAETTYANISTDTHKTVAFAGLGVAFDAESIKETIELFFQ